MDTKRLKELAGVRVDEMAPGFGAGFGKERSNDSEAIDMVLSNLRTMKMALEQGNMQAVQEELQKAMSMLVRAKTGK